MNERQRDMFLWKWSRSRRPGRPAVAIRGAVIGALGGVVFSVIMLSSMGHGGNRGTEAVLAWLHQGLLMFGLSVPAFGGMGFVSAYRVFSSQEAIYESLLKAGARVPDQKPVLGAGDRGPAIAVAIVVAVIVAFIVFVFIKLG